jgi:hypothetical protein
MLFLLLLLLPSLIWVLTFHGSRGILILTLSNWQAEEHNMHMCSYFWDVALFTNDFRFHTRTHLIWKKLALNSWLLITVVIFQFRLLIQMWQCKFVVCNSCLWINIDFGLLLSPCAHCKLNCVLNLLYSKYNIGSTHSFHYIMIFSWTKHYIIRHKMLRFCVKQKCMINIRRCQEKSGCTVCPHYC